MDGWVEIGRWVGGRTEVGGWQGVCRLLNKKG